jgi:hypothetical protein
VLVFFLFVIARVPMLGAVHGAVQMPSAPSVANLADGAAGRGEGVERLCWVFSVHSRPRPRGLERFRCPPVRRSVISQTAPLVEERRLNAAGAVAAVVWCLILFSPASRGLERFRCLLILRSAIPQTPLRGLRC